MPSFQCCVDYMSYRNKHVVGNWVLLPLNYAPPVIGRVLHEGTGRRSRRSTTRRKPPSSQRQSWNAETVHFTAGGADFPEARPPSSRGDWCSAANSRPREDALPSGQPHLLASSVTTCHACTPLLHLPTSRLGPSVCKLMETSRFFCGDGTGGMCTFIYKVYSPLQQHFKILKDKNLSQDDLFDSTSCHGPQVPSTITLSKTGPSAEASLSLSGSIILIWMESVKGVR